MNMDMNTSEEQRKLQEHFIRRRALIRKLTIVFVIICALIIIFLAVGMFPLLKSVLIKLAE